MVRLAEGEARRKIEKKEDGENQVAQACVYIHSVAVTGRTPTALKVELSRGGGCNAGQSRPAATTTEAPFTTP